MHYSENSEELRLEPPSQDLSQERIEEKGRGICCHQPLRKLLDTNKNIKPESEI